MLLLRHLELFQTKTQGGKLTLRARFMQRVHNALAVQSDVGVDVFITAPQTQIKVHLPALDRMVEQYHAIRCSVFCACITFGAIQCIKKKNGLRFSVH